MKAAPFVPGVSRLPINHRRARTLRLRIERIGRLNELHVAALNISSKKRRVKHLVRIAEHYHALGMCDTARLVMREAGRKIGWETPNTRYHASSESQLKAVRAFRARQKARKYAETHMERRSARK